MCFENMIVFNNSWIMNLKNELSNFGLQNLF